MHCVEETFKFVHKNNHQTLIPYSKLLTTWNGKYRKKNNKK